MEIMDDISLIINNKVCRLCPSNEFLFDLYLPDNLEVREVLNLFVKVEDEITTKLPKFICETCKHIVENIIEFRDACKERDKKLREENDFKNPVKEDFPIEEVTVKEEYEFLNEFMEEEFLEDELLEQKPKPKVDEKLPIKSDRLKKKEFPCSFCTNVYSIWSELIEHKKADHLQCPVCLRLFPSFRIMSHHKVNSHAGDTHCDICGKYLKSRLYLAPHIRKAHNNERNHKCDICGKLFFRLFDLKNHLSTHNEIKSEICDFENCGKAFKCIKNLKAHKKTHFPPDKKPLKKQFKQQNTSVIKQPSKEFVCQYCGKILKSSSGWTIHMRIHRNEKPFECKSCDKKFGDKSTLVVHERIHQNIRPYQCDECPLKFKSRIHLKSHKISIHETEMKHECHICGKRTKMKSNLTLHLKTHGIGKNKNDLE